MIKEVGVHRILRNDIVLKEIKVSQGGKANAKFTKGMLINSTCSSVQKAPWKYE